MNSFVAIDPSINETGVCIVKYGKPVSVIEVSNPARGSLGDRVTNMAEAIEAAIFPYDVLPRIIELPHIREDTPNPDSIIKLTLVCGAVTTSNTEYVKPRTWKKNTKKEVKTRRIEAQLRQEFPELASQLDAIPESVRHNALDAAGIALWKLGIIWEKRSRK
jgi:Holliday junction resolvasome RuvABC endonuclease subunit